MTNLICHLLCIDNELDRINERLNRLFLATSQARHPERVFSREGSPDGGAMF